MFATMLGINNGNVPAGQENVRRIPLTFLELMLNCKRFKERKPAI
jgi:hypothetical protein